MNSGPHLTLDLVLHDGTKPMASIAEAEPPGSISSHEQDGTRNVYIFGWHNGQRGVWRSPAGYDLATDLVRIVATPHGELEQLTNLDAPYELTIRTLSGHLVTIRFTYVAHRTAADNP